MGFETVDLEVCAECIMFLANGPCEGCESCVFSDDPASEPCQTVADRMVALWGDDARHMVPACGEDCDEPFSWSSCDGCGSTLGGTRHAAAVLIPRDE